MRGGEGCATSPPIPCAPVGWSALLFLLPFCPQGSAGQCGATLSGRAAGVWEPDAILPRWKERLKLVSLDFRYCYQYQYDGHKKISATPNVDFVEVLPGTRFPQTPSEMP
jgi:hypothetical protein